MEIPTWVKFLFGHWFSSATIILSLVLFALAFTTKGWGAIGYIALSILLFMMFIVSIIVNYIRDFFGIDLNWWQDGIVVVLMIVLSITVFRLTLIGV